MIRSLSVLSVAAVMAAGLAFADTPTTTPAVAPAIAPAPATSIAPVASNAPAAAMLSLNDIEARVKARGYTVKEMKVRDKVVDVEARDAKGREYDLLIDRRSGETLYEKLDD